MVNEKTNSILGFRSFAPSLRSSLDLLGRSPMVAFLPGSEFFYFCFFFSRKPKDSGLSGYYARTYCLLSKGKANVQPHNSLNFIPLLSGCLVSRYLNFF